MNPGTRRVGCVQEAVLTLFALIVALSIAQVAQNTLRPPYLFDILLRALRMPPWRTIRCDRALVCVGEAKGGRQQLCYRVAFDHTCGLLTSGFEQGYGLVVLFLEIDLFAFWRTALIPDTPHADTK